MAPPKIKSTRKAKPCKAKSSKSKSSKVKSFKANSFFGLPIEIRQLILLYTITDEDLEKNVLKRWGPSRFSLSSHWFDTERLRDWTLLLMGVDSVIKGEVMFVHKKWMKRGWKLAELKGK
jgi:hypothetical protein